jgi:hypothetical protein
MLVFMRRQLDVSRVLALGDEDRPISRGVKVASGAGLEPTEPYGRGLLSLLRSPPST